MPTLPGQARRTRTARRPAAGARGAQSRAEPSTPNGPSNRGRKQDQRADQRADRQRGARGAAGGRAPLLGRGRAEPDDERIQCQGPRGAQRRRIGRIREAECAQLARGNSPGDEHAEQEIGNAREDLIEQPPSETADRWVDAAHEPSPLLIGQRSRSRSPRTEDDDRSRGATPMIDAGTAHLGHHHARRKIVSAPTTAARPLTIEKATSDAVPPCPTLSTRATRLSMRAARRLDFSRQTPSPRVCLRACALRPKDGPRRAPRPPASPASVARQTEYSRAACAAREPGPPAAQHLFRDLKQHDEIGPGQTAPAEAGARGRAQPEPPRG